MVSAKHKHHPEEPNTHQPIRHKAGRWRGREHVVLPTPGEGPNPSVQGSALSPWSDGVTADSVHHKRQHTALGGAHLRPGAMRQGSFQREKGLEVSQVVQESCKCFFRKKQK